MVFGKNKRGCHQTCHCTPSADLEIYKEYATVVSVKFGNILLFSNYEASAASLVYLEICGSFQNKFMHMYVSTGTKAYLDV
jgi:hypothetical protein